MKHLEESVRAAVEELAATAPYAADLADAARARGRRIRRRRRAVVGLVAAALAGTVLTPYAILDERRGAPPPLPIAPTPTPSPSLSPSPSRMSTEAPYMAAGGKKWWTEPVKLTNDLVVTAVGGKWVAKSDGHDVPPDETLREGSVYLDRQAGRYRVFPGGYQVFQAAPTGRYVLVQSNTANRIGIADTVTGAVRMLDHGSGSGVQWSPDGTKLLLTLIAGGFRIIDARTGARQDHDAAGRGLCPDHCFFTWLPGGKEVALAQRDPGVAQSEARPDTVKSVNVYSAATGELLRELALPGVPASSNAWSPDGRHVVLLPDATAPDEMRIAEVATGRVVGRIAADASVAMRFVGPDIVLAVGGTDLYLHELDGTLQLKVALPADFAGREISLGSP